MLFKNHQKVNLATDPLYVVKKAEFESFLKGKKTVVFKTRDKIIINPTGYVEPERTHTIPVEVTLTGDDGYSVDQWNYCERAPKILQNKDLKYDKTPIFIKGDLVLPVADKEQIFFLMYISPVTKNGRLLVVDEAKEDEKKVQTIASKSRIDFILTDEDYSPIKEADIRKIAKAFGVDGVDKMSKARVILNLKAVIELASKEGDAERNEAAFLEAIKMSDAVTYKAQVQEAIDDGRIRFDELQSVYYYANEAGENIKKIISVDLIYRDVKSKRMNVLLNYYLSNPEKLKELQRILNYTTDEIDFSKIEYSSLKKLAASVGVNGAGKQEEIVQRMVEFYALNKDKVKFDKALIAVGTKED